MLRCLGTVEPEGWPYEASDGSQLVLIDTPGFNDSSRPDLDLLRSIVDFVHEKRLKVISILYIQRINERRLTGSTRNNLRMLRAMAGEHFYQNIVLLTSMWSVIPTEELDDAYQRELQFQQAPQVWADLLEKGATCYRWDETEHNHGSHSADEIIEVCETKMGAPAMNVLLETDKGKVLEDTTAGRILTEEIRKRQERERENLREEQEQLQALNNQRIELETLATRMQEDVRRERRLSRPTSVSSSASSTAMQAAQRAYKNREPVVYPSIPVSRSVDDYPRRRRHEDDDIAPPPYDLDERRQNASSSPRRLERRHTDGSEDLDERVGVVVVYEGRSDEERRPRRRRSKKGSKFGRFVRDLREDFTESEYMIVRRRR